MRDRLEDAHPSRLAQPLDVRARQNRQDDGQNLAVHDVLLDARSEERVVDADPVGQESVGLWLGDEDLEQAVDEMRLRKREGLIARDANLLPHPVDKIGYHVGMLGRVLEERIHD